MGDPTSSAPHSTHLAQAVAIANGRILAVGMNADAQSYADRNTRIVDLNGRLTVPGFIDSHTHFLAGGSQLVQVQLKDAANEEEFTRRIAAKAATLAPGRWMLGGDWDEQAWPFARLPTRQLIDAVTRQTPVLLSRYDWHMGLANSLALELAGINRNTPDPQGGVIVRDRTGEPTGILRDAAKDLVAKIVPRPTETAMAVALRAALSEAARVGLTSVHSITLDADSWNGSFTGEIQLFARAEREGWLTCRVYEIAPITRWKELREIIAPHHTSGLVKLGAVKAFADGSLGSATAWMDQPFADDPANRGLPLPLMTPPSRMEALAQAAHHAGLQVCIHAIGDRANAEILDIYARLGGNDAASRRFRIEHAQHVRPQDFARFGKLGVIASMQPYHAIDDGRWAEARLGGERAKCSYAWRSMLDAGAHLAFGSDWPIAPLSPILGIHAAVTRATLDAKHASGWFPEQRLTAEEALRAYTAGSAYAGFQENETGTLEAGKLADLVVLSDDLFTIPPAKIKEVEVILTMMGGRVAFSKLPDVPAPTGSWQW